MTDLLPMLVHVQLLGIDWLDARLVQPALFFVVGQAASGGDVEAWLDATFSLFNRKFWNIPAMRARAEAARWRGDDVAAAAWTERAAKLAQRAGTPERLVLARLAGLSLRHRWAGWDRAPFTDESSSHVSVWEKTEQ